MTRMRRGEQTQTETDTPGGFEGIFVRAQRLASVAMLRSFSRVYDHETPWTLAPSFNDEMEDGGPAYLRLQKCELQRDSQPYLGSLRIIRSPESELYSDGDSGRLESRAASGLVVIHNRLAYAALYNGLREATYVTDADTGQLPRVEEILDKTEQTFSF